MWSCRPARPPKAPPRTSATCARAPWILPWWRWPDRRRRASLPGPSLPSTCRCWPRREGLAAGGPSVDRPEAARPPFIEAPAGWGNRAVADRAFAARGLPRTVRFEVNDYQTAVAMVRTGLGVALLPASSARELAAQSGVALVDVTGADLTWTISLAVAAGGAGAGRGGV